jgi:hypothetical protein
MLGNQNTFFENYVNFILRVNDKWEPVSFTDKEKYHFLLPMTYINPSYLAIGFLTTVSALSNMGHKVSILIHDVNLLVHAQSKREMMNKGRFSISNYIEYILEEIETILIVLQANMDNVRIIRASEIWGGMSQNESEFFTFYSILGGIRFNGGIKNSDRFYYTAYHAIQRPFDIFFAKRYSRLYLPDWGNPDFVIIPLDRHVSYTYIRNKISVSSAVTTQNVRSPLFCTLRPSFVLSYNDTMPACGMTAQEIEDIILKSKISTDNMKLTLANVIVPIAEFLNGVGVVKELDKLSPKPTAREVSKYMYSVLDSLWKRIYMYSDIGDKDIYITSRFKFNEIQEILSSKAMVKTLFYCDGSSSVSDIATRTSQQLSNTSYYVSKLRKAGLVSSGPKPKIKFRKIVLDAKSMLTGFDAEG